MKIAMIGCCAALALALPARAQTVGPEPVAATQDVAPAPTAVIVAEPAPEAPPPSPEPTANAGAFDALPPGGQKIARALYAAQAPIASTDGGAAGWSLDEVAAARSQGGWGIVLKQMQAEGLVSAKSVGEVVSGRAGAPLPPQAPAAQAPVVVSYGNSDAATIATGGKAHRHATAPAIVTAAGGGGSVAVKPHGGHAAATAATIANAGGGPGHGGGKGKSDKHGK